MKSHHSSARLLIALLLALSLAIGSLPAVADWVLVETQPEPFVQSIQEMITRNWPHMGKVWPGLDYAKHNLVLLHLNDASDVEAGWLLNVQGSRKLVPNEYEQLVAPQVGGYAAAVVEGKPSIVMSVDKTSLSGPGEDEQTFRTATHEMVHFYYQNDWTEDQQGSRAQPYPLDAKPRFYRQMIYQRMIQAFDAPAIIDEMLAKAKHWLEKWQQEFSDEAQAIRSTDMAEGSAKYVENLSAVIGSATDQQDLRNRQGNEIARDALFAAADEESYELGYVATLLLDITQPGWKADFYKRGLSPVEQLLQPVGVAKDVVDEGIWKRVTDEVNEVNADARHQMTDVLRAREDRSIPWLRVNTTKATGSYQARGNYLLGEDDVVTGFTAQYHINGAPLSIRDASVIMEYSDEGESFILLPLTMAHQIKDGLLTFTEEGAVTGEIRVESSERSGTTTYSAVATNL